MSVPGKSEHPRVCVIGAGACGITVGKNLLQAGIKNFVIFDKGTKVGGNWVYSPTSGHSSVYEFAHTISSKSLSQYSDYAYPKDTPAYPSHDQIASYLQGYAQHFGVSDHIRFGTEVVALNKLAESSWRATLAGGSTESFEAVIVCNGHHWSPRLPNYPGSFSGRTLHSHDFKQAGLFRDDRVLVVGAGNSGCDIAVKLADTARSTALSLRRGYHIIPKRLFGIPSDVLLAWCRWIPRPVLQRLANRLIWLSDGGSSRNALPKPDHRVLESHPVINSHLTRYAQEQRIAILPDIAQFDGNQVHFVDGSVKIFDTIIFCTGYDIRFPFLDSKIAALAKKQLYLRMIVPGHSDLFFVGLFQPVGCIWPLAELQAKIAAQALLGNYHPPADWETRMQAQSLENSSLFISSARHAIEVDFYKFRRDLLHQVATCSRDVR